jgi:ribosomal protein S6--L-glutamate ligase
VTAAQRPAVAFVLGRPPGPASVLHDVQARLRAAGVTLTTVVEPDGDGPDADLLVLKDLGAATLEALAGRARSGDVDCCNDAAATARSLDKVAVGRVLRAAGLRVPAEVVLDDWDEVRRAAAGGRVVVKPGTGSQGEGVLLLDGPAPLAPPTPGPWLVQEHVAGDGLDRKCYVVDDAVDVVLRTWPAPADRSGRPAEVDPALRSVALRTAAALELEVCGVDVLDTADGPVVVDVNAWPGFKGVPLAAERLSRHLLARVRSREVLTCASSS